MTYKTTSLCDEDVIEIYVRGLTDFGIGQAEKYHSGLMTTFALIASNPRLARRRTEFEPPVRMHPYQAHIIVYVEDEGEEGVLILRVLHRRQEIGRHLRLLRTQP